MMHGMICAEQVELVALKTQSECGLNIWDSFKILYFYVCNCPHYCMQFIFTFSSMDLGFFAYHYGIHVQYVVKKSAAGVLQASAASEYLPKLVKTLAPSLRLVRIHDTTVYLTNSDKVQKAFHNLRLHNLQCIL